MPALRELQARFCDAMLAADAAPAEARLLECLVETDETGRRRIAAYRRSIFGNLAGALAATYPVLERIVGQPFFRAMAHAYVRARPSRSGDLNEYGSEFADFVAAWPHAQTLGYLADVARLEWCVQQVYYAPAAAVELSALAACPPQGYGALHFLPAPAFARLDSAWPLADIWRVNAAGYTGEMTVDFAQGAQVAIFRRAGRVHVEALSAGEAAFIDALAGGRKLEAAAGAALAAEAEFNLGAALARCVREGFVVRAWFGEQA